MCRNRNSKERYDNNVCIEISYIETFEIVWEFLFPVRFE